MSQRERSLPKVNLYLTHSLLRIIMKVLNPKKKNTQDVHVPYISLRTLITLVNCEYLCVFLL